MPPRSYYNSPRVEDYSSYVRAFFPECEDRAQQFIRQYGLPFIESDEHIAGYIGVSSSLIRQVLHKRNYHYREFSMPKADGTERRVSTPKTYLKVIHWWINDNILSHRELHEAVHGFRVGRSYITNASAHLGAKHLLNLDIEKFFPSISAEMVQALFTSMGYSGSGAKVLTALTTLRGSAPTGAPTSPYIGNLVLSEFDRQVSEFSAEHGLTYTRYADDLTFSAVDWIPLETASKIQKLVEAFGFKLNGNKTKFMGPGDRMDVTGIIINDGLSISREWRNWARGFVQRAIRNPQDYAHKHQQISGIYGALRSVDSESANALTRNAQLAAMLTRKEALRDDHEHAGSLTV